MQVQATLAGVGYGLMMHNERLADPMSEYTKLIKVINAKGSKRMTDDDLMERSRLEWEGGLYWRKEDGPYINLHNVVACLIQAGRARRWGPTVQRSVFPVGISEPLLYNGPRDMDGMWNGGQIGGFFDRRMVGVNSNRVQRTRPFFPNWSLVGEFILDTELFDWDNFQTTFALAGKAIGLGDARSIGFGRFTVDLEITADDRPLSA